MTISQAIRVRFWFALFRVAGWFYGHGMAGVMRVRFELEAKGVAEEPAPTPPPYREGW